LQRNEQERKAPRHCFVIASTYDATLAEAPRLSMAYEFSNRMQEIARRSWAKFADRDALQTLTTQLPHAVTLAFAVALIVQVALVGLNARRLSKDSALFGNPVVAVSAGRGHSALDLRPVVAAHLFGVAPTPESDSANVPTTSVPLVLSGVLAGNDPTRGLAILGPPAGKSLLYKVGESVPGGALLHAVYSDRVVLDRAGLLEALLFPRLRSLAGGLLNREVAEVASEHPDRGLRTSLPTVDHHDRGSMLAAIEEMRTRKRVYGEVIRARAVVDNGKMTGMRADPGRSSAAFARLGLQPGDVITSINDTPLNDPQTGMGMLAAIGSAGEGRVTVLRGGQPLALTLDLSTLTDGH
jgi:general secretion pathway protein C